MENQATYIIVLYLIINAIAFATMLVDKIKSTRPGAERISEGMLFFMATAFGSLGVYAGMFAFRHKTRKWYFLLGIPMLIIENSAVVYLVYQYLLGSQ
jgi:uncharacterized membrane protein YsdA (DUF1294 family)